MTPFLLSQPSTAGRRDNETSERRKSVLFCPNCSHESPTDGDWRVARVDRRTRREKTVYTCPECARTIAVRPGGGRDRSRDEDRDQDRSQGRNRNRNRSPPSKAP